MIKIKVDSQGKLYVRYKKKKFYLPKKYKKATQQAILKFLIRELAKAKIKKIIKRRLQKKKKGITQKEDKNAKEIVRKEVENKNTQDKPGNLNYINALRAQQQLPPVTGQQTLVQTEKLPKELKDLATKLKQEPNLLLLTHEPKEKGEEKRSGVSSALKKTLISQTKQAKDEAARAIATTKEKIREKVISEMKRHLPAQTELIKRVEALNEERETPLAIDKSVQGKKGKKSVRKSKVELFEMLLEHDPLVQDNIRVKVEQELEKELKTGDEQLKKEAEDDDEPVPPLHYEGEEKKDGEDAEGDAEGDQHGEGGLSNLQIDKYMKHDRGFIGTIASDEIPTKIIPNAGQSGSFVMNLQDHTKPGSHWVAIYWNDRTMEYYDPLGDPPTQQVKSDLVKLMKKLGGFRYLKINHIQRQSNTTDTCGFHAMKYIRDREKGKSFAEATGYNDHMKDDHVNGEKAVNKFIHHMTGNGFSFISGDGIVDDVKDVAGKVIKRVSDVLKGVRQRASPSIRKFLESNGQAKITKIVVGRQPVTPMVEKVANWLSLGKYEENKKKLAYDKMFHLFMMITLNNGKTFKLEKNHLPEITQTSSPGKATLATQSVSTPSNLTLDEFFKKGESKAGGNKLWVYDAITQNCQWFVKWMLQGAGVWSSSLEKFAMQDAAKTIEGMSWFQKLARKLTDTANVADVAVNGEGKKKKSKSTV